MKKSRLKDIRYFCDQVCAKGRCDYMSRTLYRNLKRLHANVGEPTEAQIKEVVQMVLPVKLKEGGVA